LVKGFSPITNPFLVSHPVHLLENTPSSPVGELAQLESTLNNVLEMLDRVLAYAQEAAAGKPADAALGRYLMGALGGGAEESGKGGGFTSSLQVRPVAQVRDEIIYANTDALCYS
jgi:hypothetical protein